MFVYVGVGEGVREREGTQKKAHVQRWQSQAAAVTSRGARRQPMAVSIGARWWLTGTTRCATGETDPKSCAPTTSVSYGLPSHWGTDPQLKCDPRVT